VQLFAAVFGAAAAGMVANFAVLTQPGGVTGAANAAFWLFAVFVLAPVLCIPAARRAANPGPHATGAAECHPAATEAAN
jgi:hypothetical protein